MSNKDERGYVRFTGDYSKLKSMGFTFQKLFASNYMQWERNGYRVWKKGHDITHDDFKLFKLIRFLRTNPELNKFAYRNKETGYMFYKIYYATEYNQYEYDYHPYNAATQQKFKDYYLAVHEHLEAEKAGKPVGEFPEPLGDTVIINEKKLDVLKEFEKLGWYELDYYPE